MINCSVCGSNNENVVINFGNIPLCDQFKKSKEEAKEVKKYPIEIYLCKKCQHAELGEKASKEEIYESYTYQTSRSPGLDAHFDEYADWLQKKFGLDKKYHLDIGCNDGVLLDKSKLKGANTLGVEPSPIGDIARNKGHNVYKNYFGTSFVSSVQLTESVDIITSNNTFANVFQLHDFVSAAKTILKETGILVIETMHFKSQVKNAIFEMMNHEHFHYFSVASIREIFERNGMKLLGCKKINTKGGSMRGGGMKKETDSKKYETILELDDDNIDDELRSFNQKLLDIKKAIHQKIETRNPKQIFAFGAVGGSIILSYALDINSKIDYYVDDNSNRHNFYSPFDCTQIVTPEFYYDCKPDMTIILAWRFADMIISKHKGKLPNSHEFVIPVKL